MQLNLKRLNVHVFLAGTIEPGMNQVLAQDLHSGT